MRALRAPPGVVDVLTQVIGPNVKAMQSMLFIKAEGKPGQAWHQDEYFIPTRDRSLTGGWIALDDATVENGCLWVHPRLASPGSSTRPRARRRALRLHRSRPYDFPYADEDAIPVEIPAGSSCSSTATCCTARFRTRASTGCAARS